MPHRMGHSCGQSGSVRQRSFAASTQLTGSSGSSLQGVGLVLGAEVGDEEGDRVGLVLGAEVGIMEGDRVGLVLGAKVGDEEGDGDVGLPEGDAVGVDDGMWVVGEADGVWEGVLDGEADGADEGEVDGDAEGEDVRQIPHVTAHTSLAFTLGSLLR